MMSIVMLGLVEGTSADTSKMTARIRSSAPVLCIEDKLLPFIKEMLLKYTSVAFPIINFRFVAKIPRSVLMF